MQLCKWRLQRVLRLLRRTLLRLDRLWWLVLDRDRWVLLTLDSLGTSLLGLSNNPSIATYQDG